MRFPHNSVPLRGRSHFVHLVTSARCKDTEFLATTPPSQHGPLAPQLHLARGARLRPRKGGHVRRLLLHREGLRFAREAPRQVGRLRPPHRRRLRDHRHGEGQLRQARHAPRKVGRLRPPPLSAIRLRATGKPRVLHDHAATTSNGNPSAQHFVFCQESFHRVVRLQLSAWAVLVIPTDSNEYASFAPAISCRGWEPAYIFRL
ncbi:hypothetical protein T492DRAFT_1025529 [Pavlovales sp. CCMP2436]|nr:hypothetical protein T492DRAFT_1025529 [Pavlovales sp. CCMP2436]